MQHLWYFILQGLLWPFSLVQALDFSEHFETLQLIGSHFGVPNVSRTYDYVIVGGGTAGLVVARRLASNSSLSIAVIEAGGFYEFDNGNSSEVPGYASQLTRKSRVRQICRI